MSERVSRRALLKAAVAGAAALPVAAAMLPNAQAAQGIPLLKESDVTAKSLAYVADLQARAGLQQLQPVRGRQGRAAGRLHARARPVRARQGVVQVVGS